MKQGDYKNAFCRDDLPLDETVHIPVYGLNENEGLFLGGVSNYLDLVKQF